MSSWKCCNTHTHKQTHAHKPPPTGPVLVLELGGWQHDVELDGGSGGDQVLWFRSRSGGLLGVAAGDKDAAGLRSAGKEAEVR